MKGKILRAEPDRLLKYTLANRRKNASASTVTDVLSYENGITTLTVIDDVGQGPAQRSDLSDPIKDGTKF